MEIALAALAIITLAVSARWTWWRRKTPGLEVLCYHKIGTPPPGSRLRELWVSPEKFRAQLKFLLERGYKTLLFSDLLKAYRDNVPLPEKSVQIGRAHV